MKKILMATALLLTLTLVGCGKSQPQDRVVYQDENIIITVGKDTVAENLTDTHITLEYKQIMYGESYDMADALFPQSRTKLYFFDEEGEIFYKKKGGN